MVYGFGQKYGPFGIAAIAHNIRKRPSFDFIRIVVLDSCQKNPKTHKWGVKTSHIDHIHPPKS